MGLATNAEGVSIMDKLTNRERQIAKLLATGMTQRQIAHALGIKAGSCYNHTQRMRDRTGETTVSLAVKAALSIRTE